MRALRSACVGVVVAAAGLCGSLATASGPESPVESLKAWMHSTVKDRPSLEKQTFTTMPLTKAEAATALGMLWDAHADISLTLHKKEWDAKAITIGDKTMKFEFKVFGEKPKTGRSLFISMHGGGGAPASVNEQQWKNQVGLYKPAEGVYVAPRAPTDTWNLWHEGHIDGLFDRLIEDMVVFEGVDPNRVYLMGYSAGGDGVYQLGPRLADRWAAASMMAGHPNDASPLNLRNVPFAIHVGANDGAYNRNAVAKAWGEKLDALRKDDPKGYEHVAELHAGKGHWMDRDDAKAVAWMAAFTRSATPERVVWRQGGPAHSRSYWLKVKDADKKPGTVIVATYKPGEVVIESAEGLTGVTVLLSDAMMDLDKPLKITKDGKTLFEGKVQRTIESLAASLEERADKGLMFPARVSVDFAPADAAPK
ncbi:MAG: alpha/beta hydrolase [Planctomycetota bacterium]